MIHEITTTVTLEDALRSIKLQEWNRVATSESCPIYCSLEREGQLAGSNFLVGSANIFADHKGDEHVFELDAAGRGFISEWDTLFINHKNGHMTEAEYLAKVHSLPFPYVVSAKKVSKP